MALVIFAGCTGKPKTEIQTKSGNVAVSEGTGPASEWCKAGTTITSTGPSAQASYVIKGLTTYNNTEVCEAEAKVAGQGSWTYYYNKDGSYGVIIIKDASGKVLNEINVKNP